MISIFLNYVKKTFPYNTFNNSNNFDNTNNNIDNFGEFIKRKNTKTKLFKISKEYINKCNLISKKEKERYQKIREKCLEVMSTDEEDSFEKKNNNNNIINNIISLKKINKSSEKYISPQKKYYAEEPDFEYSNRFIKYNNKKSLNKKKIINLNNNKKIRIQAKK